MLHQSKRVIGGILSQVQLLQCVINLNIVIQLHQIIVFNSKIIFVHMDKQGLYANLVIIMGIYFGDKDFLIV
jgi:hypothetical protein